MLIPGVTWCCQISYGVTHINHIRKKGNIKFDNMALHYSGRILLICDLTNAYIIMFINVFDKLMMKT